MSMKVIFEIKGPIGDVPIIVPSLQLLCPDCVGDDL